MGSSFNAQVLAEKLAKLNGSQASIETLSHWCIFHMNKAKHVVEIWGRQFHCSPREQRLAYLYLANDILQNSRRRGSEFVGEFWNVLPEALRDVIQNGDDSERKSALRLVRESSSGPGQKQWKHLLPVVNIKNSFRPFLRQFSLAQMVHVLVDFS